MSQNFSLRQTDIVITVASWEERFLLGMKRLIKTVQPSRILMFHYEKYAKWSNDNRKQISDLCKGKGITMEGDIELSFGSPLDSWKKLVAQTSKIVISKKLITLDISTMPREVIWSVCHVLSQQQVPLQYVYYKPKDNGYGDWLSRDPGRPRLLYRLAGIQHIGRPTALVVQTGYDVERVKQLARFYEPEKLLLGLQTGEQFENTRRNREKHKNAFRKHNDAKMFDVDGYSLNGNFNTFVKFTKPLLENYNVILSSLGPKVGALSLFKVKQKLPDVAMTYTPSNEFNRDYSSGIGDCIHGILSDEQ
jgi:hypothetical protein